MEQPHSRTEGGPSWPILLAGKEEVVKRTFTFGHGQSNPRTGQSLANHYVVIEGESNEHCRATMHNHFGRNWAFEYASPEAAGKDEFNLQELPKDEWPFSSGNYTVNDQGACVYVG